MVKGFKTFKSTERAREYAKQIGGYVVNSGAYKHDARLGSMRVTKVKRR
jgi:hypothetical protein